MPAQKSPWTLLQSNMNVHDSWMMNDVRTRRCRSQATTLRQVSWWGDPSSFLKINQLTYFPFQMAPKESICFLLACFKVNRSSCTICCMQSNMSIFLCTIDDVYSTTSFQWVTLRIANLWWQWTGMWKWTCGSGEMNQR